MVLRWRNNLGEALPSSLPGIDEPLVPAARNTAKLQGRKAAAALSFTDLLQMRKQNQTRLAATSVRTTGNDSPEFDAQQAETARRAIIRKMHEVLRSQKDQGIGTGLERAVRIQHKAVGNTASSTSGLGMSGNAANAALAASSKAITVRSYFYSFV